MRPYRHLEAYQLTRRLLAGVYEVTPAQAHSDAMSHRLRSSAVAAANSLVGISSEAGVTATSVPLGEAAVASMQTLGGAVPQQPARALSARVELARQALDDVANVLAEYHRQGQLSDHSYETLRGSQERATAALAELE